MNSFSKQELKSQVPKAILSGALTAAFMYVLFFKGYQSILAGASIGFLCILEFLFIPIKLKRGIYGKPIWSLF